MFEIDPDISAAFTPPARIYHDPAVYGACRTAVFARSWQLLADANDVRIAGQTLPLTLLEGCLDEPLLLTRDRGDRLHCLSNVCTHRGMLVCEHPGVVNSLRCRYHGRRFALDGAFQQMPEFDGVRDFPGPGDSLPRLALERWGPLLFSTVAPAVAFDDWLGPVRQRLGWLPLDEFRLEPQRSRDYLVEANWALYVENYLEGFHIPYVHAALNEAVDYGSYRTECWAHGNVQIAGGHGGAHAFELPPASSDHGASIAAFYYWLFPNLMLNFYPWGLSVNVVKPLAATRTRVSFLCYVWRPELLDRGAGAELDRVEREDEVIVEAVQRGLRGRLYDRGRYSPKREQGTHHFHRLLAAALAAE